METKKHHYVAFGLHVVSDFSLPGLEAAENSRLPKVCIKKAELDRNALLEINDDGKHLAGQAREVMLFRVETGNTILVDPMPGADINFMRAILSGELLAALLRQRGLLVLHGSCVAKDGKAIGFVGGSGWGKSTLAAYFTQRGYQLLTDDVLAIDCSAPRPLVIPGHAQMKLRDDSGNMLRAGFSDLPVAHGQTDKRLFSHDEAFSQTVVPIERIYLLENRIRSSNQLGSLPEQEAFIEMVRHTRVTQMIKDETYRAAHFEQCARLMRHVSVVLLERDGNLESLEEIFNLIEDDAQQNLRESRELSAVRAFNVPR